MNKVQKPGKETSGNDKWTVWLARESGVGNEDGEVVSWAELGPPKFVC